MIKLRNLFLEYIYTNRIFLSYVVLSFVCATLVRYYTIGNTFGIRALLMDFALILFIGSFGYFIRASKQFTYYFVVLIFISFLGVVNSIYFTFFSSFISFSLISSLSQVGEVGDSLFEKLRLVDFIYVIFPLFFYYIHRLVNQTNYYSLVAKVEKGKRLFAATIAIASIIIFGIVLTFDNTDYSRLSKQWNKDSLVSEFGIILYQGNDIVQSITPRINTLFGYDEASLRFRDFFTEEFTNNIGEDATNDYTNILEGRNVVFVHMESIQTFLVDMEVNGQEISPTLNKLADEGMYFSNFFPQISSGTSADTEFTLNTSLMPALSGIVNINYVNREYNTIPKYLSDLGYYTFSTHGNKADMWNRHIMHPALGYKDFFAVESYDLTDENELGLGLNDQSFFQQFYPRLLEINNSYENYMGTVITLTNHSPFLSSVSGNEHLYFTYGDLDLTNTYTSVDDNGIESEVVDDYLEDSKLGNYLQSVHYADNALGEFLQLIELNSDLHDLVFVFYGDHEAKLSKSEFEYYYNYDIETGNVRTEEDPLYVDFDNYMHDLNKNTPLIIWSPDTELRSKLNTQVDNVMGVIDIMPTIGNMLGFYNPFALGNDIFEIKEDNVVVFPNGNFVTNSVYYRNSDSAHYVRGEGLIIEENYIDDLIEYTDFRLQLSYDIILHDLILNEGEKLLENIGVLE